MRQANAAAAAAIENSWNIRLRIHFNVLRTSSFWRQPVIPVRTARWLPSQRILIQMLSNLVKRLLALPTVFNAGGGKDTAITSSGK